MTGIHSVENMRLSDKMTIESGTPGTELMARAGRGIFEAAAWKPPVAVVCGTGNNAGDGYVLALLLLENNIPCTVFLLAEKWSADGRYYYDKCVSAGVEIRLIPEKPDFSAYGSVADCLFGTGFSGEVKGKAKDVIEAINRSGAYVVSADINSGLSGDGGMAVSAVRSDLTVSVGAFQPGHFLNMAKDLIKEKINVNIGIGFQAPPYLLADPAYLKAAFPPRKNFSNKSTYGYVGLIGGSVKYAGAVKLASLANAAVRGGAGVVKLAAPASLCAALRPEVLEATLFPLSDDNGDLVFREEEMKEFTKGLKAVAFGMGAGLSDETGRMLAWLLQNYTGKLVIDADGLNALAKTEKTVLRKAACRVLLTPHNMEFSRLSGHSVDEILADPIPLARAFAKETKTVLLLKGPATVITDGETVLLTDRGCPGMATAGSGDVLSGVLAALCGYNDDLLLAAAAGAWLNGRAGELAQEAYGAVSMTAGDTAANLPRAVRELTDD